MQKKKYKIQKSKKTIKIKKSKKNHKIKSKLTFFSLLFFSLIFFSLFFFSNAPSSSFLFNNKNIFSPLFPSSFSFSNLNFPLPSLLSLISWFSSSKLLFTIYFHRIKLFSLHLSFYGQLLFLSLNPPHSTCCFIRRERSESSRHSNQVILATYYRQGFLQHRYTKGPNFE